MTRLKTIAEYGNRADADLARAFLESEGIWCFLADAQIYGIVLTTFSIRLQVKEEDVDRASRLLATAESAVGETANEEAYDSRGGTTQNDSLQRKVIPTYSHRFKVRKQRARFFFLLSLVLVVGASIYHCARSEREETARSGS